MRTTAMIDISITKRFSDISHYKLWIISLYVILFPLFFVFIPDVLRYDFSSAHLGQVLFIIAITFLGIYSLNLLFGLRKIGWRGLAVPRDAWVILYAVFFAVPEEIIFRGIVQGALQNFINNTLVLVVISSAIYGLAHLPNEAKGLRIRDWNWRFALVAFIAGLPLSFIFAITQSLLIPTLLHAFYLIFFKLFIEESTMERRN